MKDVVNLVSRTKEESQRYIENFLSLLFYKTEKPIMEVGGYLIYVKKDYPLGYRTGDFILDFWEHADKKEAYVQVGFSSEESVVKLLKGRGKNVLRVNYPRDKKFQPIPLNDLTFPYLSLIARRRGRNLPLTSKDIDLMVWDNKELGVYEIKAWRVPFECLSNTNTLCSRLATEMRWIDEINIVRKLVDERREFIQKLLKKEFNENVPLDTVEKIKSGLITLYFSPCMIKELRYVFYTCEKDLGRLNVNEQGFIMEKPEKIKNFFRLFEERIKEGNIAKQVEVGKELAKHEPLLIEREKTELKPFYKIIPEIKIDDMAKIYDEFIDGLEEGYRTAWENYKAYLKKLE